MRKPAVNNSADPDTRITSAPVPTTADGQPGTGDEQPYIPASQTSLPEFTVQAVVLGIVLSLLMTAASIYVGLYAGMTVSAAIPASVISMAVLRGVLRRGTILENNVVHTLAGAGQSVGTGIIFTVPALVLLGLWSNFNYVETTLIALAGGFLGVVMMIPLRRPMIIEQTELKYPEGVACAEVLKAGDRGGPQMWEIFIALVLGAGFKFVEASLKVFRGSVEWAWQTGRTAFYFGTDISPMLMAVGFIVGWEITLLVVLGGVISFVGAIPILAWDANFATQSPLDVVNDIWNKQIRFFGIGAMVVAGMYSIFKIAPSIGKALRSVARGISGGENAAALPRTERGITGRSLLLLLLTGLLLCAAAYQMITQDIITTVVTTLVLFVLAFFFVAVASYIVGLVGSSNSPVSGMTICSVLVAAGLLILLGYQGNAGMLATLGVAGVVCCAACTAGDICQDLKIGQIVGATPRALQIGEIIGASVAALIIAPTLYLLHAAYGIGEAAPGSAAPLKAPQANLFKELVRGLFGSSDIPWGLVGAGAAVALTVILIDSLVLEPQRAKFRLYAMPLAVGMYLPFTVTFPLIFGGLAYLFVMNRSVARGDSGETQKAVAHRGLLFASGLVAGESIMGIIVAVLIVIGLNDWLNLGLEALDLVSLAALLAVTGLLAWQALRR
jgi:putative OPT family oligopeptide transporter